MRIVTLGLAAAFLINAQSFEVASVKVTDPSGRGSRLAKGARGGGAGTADPTLFTRRNATLAALIQTAYGLQPYQIIGPAWLTSEHYDIFAKVPERTTREEQSVMLRNLLVERFALKVHRENRAMDTYSLTIAKSGKKFKESTKDDPLPAADAKITVGPDGNPVLPPGIREVTWPRGNSWIYVLHEQLSMAALITRISRELHRPIDDQTGLSGKFDIALHWAPETSASPSPSGEASDPEPTIFQALQSQLGLKLEQKKATVEVLVVDHADKVPAEN